MLCNTLQSDAQKMILIVPLGRLTIEDPPEVKRPKLDAAGNPAPPVMVMPGFAPVLVPGMPPPVVPGMVPPPSNDMQRESSGKEGNCSS